MQLQTRSLRTPREDVGKTEKSAVFLGIKNPLNHSSRQKIPTGKNRNRPHFCKQTRLGEVYPEKKFAGQPYEIRWQLKTQRTRVHEVESSESSCCVERKMEERLGSLAPNNAINKLREKDGVVPDEMGWRISYDNAGGMVLCQ